jgi:hypothetical protein
MSLAIGGTRPIRDIQVFQRMAAAIRKAVVQRYGKGRSASAGLNEANQPNYDYADGNRLIKNCRAFAASLVRVDGW